MRISWSFDPEWEIHSAQLPVGRPGQLNINLALYPKAWENFNSNAPALERALSTRQVLQTEYGLSADEAAAISAQFMNLGRDSVRSHTSYKLSMALNPEDMQSYISEHGPYMEHWTKPERVPGILNRGILPASHDTRDPDPDEDFWGDDEEEYESPGPGDIRRNWDGFAETRPGHTYLAVPGNTGIVPGHKNIWGDEPYQVPVRVDLRKLDPKNLAADEAIASDNWDNWIENYPDEEERRYLQEETPGPPNSTYWEPGTQSLGDWADDWDTNLEDPWMTNRSLNEGGAGLLAHNGPIPPEAISLHPDYMDRYPEEAHKFDPNQMSLFDRTVAKTAQGDPDPNYSFMYYKSALEVVPWHHNVRYRDIADRLLRKFNTRLEDGGFKDDEGDWAGGDIFVKPNGLQVEFKQLADPEIQTNALVAIRHWYDDEHRKDEKIKWEMEGEETKEEEMFSQ